MNLDIQQHVVMMGILKSSDIGSKLFSLVQLSIIDRRMRSIYRLLEQNGLFATDITIFGSSGLLNKML